MKNVDSMSSEEDPPLDDTESIFGWVLICVALLIYAPIVCWCALTLKEYGKHQFFIKRELPILWTFIIASIFHLVVERPIQIMVSTHNVIDDVEEGIITVWSITFYLIVFLYVLRFVCEWTVRPKF